MALISYISVRRLSYFWSKVKLYIEQLKPDHTVQDMPSLNKLLVTINPQTVNEAQYLVSREEYNAPEITGFSPVSGTSHDGSLTVTISATSGATIKYSLNGGTTWTTGSSATLPQDTSVESKSYTLKAKAEKNGLTSEIVEASYTVNRKVATPAISASGDQYSTERTVTITCGTTGASIYYTTNGSTPTSSSTQYDPNNKPKLTSTATVKAIAILSNWVNSSVKTSDQYVVGTKYTHAGLLATGDATSVVITDLTQEKKASSPNGNYTFTTSASAMYIWFVIPDTQTIHDIANGAVPQAFTLKDTTGGYKYYRLDGQMGANQSITLTVS